MAKHFNLSDDKLPERIPLFPLRDTVLLPGGDLPLNMFEPRYRAMTQWAMSTNRIIGMIQPHNKDGDLYAIGCAGRITQFQEVDDGRYLITLHGVSRFTLKHKQITSDHYWLGDVDWSDFTADRQNSCALPNHLTRDHIKPLLQRFMDKHDLAIDWDQAAHIPDERFYALLSMVAPFSAAEKQALLESIDFPTRCTLLVELLQMAISNPTSQHPVLH